MLLGEKLKIKKKIIEDEKLQKEKDTEQSRNSELHERLNTMQAEKKEWEDNLSGLEVGYDKAGESIGNLKTAGKTVDDIYTNPDFAEVIGEQPKDEFIKANEGEEEVQSYREEEKNLKERTGSLSAFKKFFKEKLPEIDFRGQEQEGKIPREESIFKIKERIGVMDKDIQAVYEQTTEGQAELKEKKKEEIINRHNPESGLARSVYTEFTEIDIEDAKKWGDDFVKGTIIDFNLQKIDEKIDAKIDVIKKDNRPDARKVLKDTDGKVKEIEEIRQEEHDLIKKEIENNWLSEALREFEDRNQDVISKQNRLEEKIKKAGELRESLDEEYNKYGEENVSVSIKKDEKENIININPKVRNKHETIKEEINQLEKEKTSYKNKKLENENTKRGLIGKKKLETELSAIKDNLKELEIIIPLKREELKEVSKKLDFFYRIQNVINNAVGYDRIDMPEGDMNYSEFKEKLKSRLEDIMKSRLDSEDEDKIKEFKILKVRLNKVYEDWGGKKVWS